ncbi:MAG: hypothetical protein WCJ37_21105, partial [Syntrophus sp. (in: bacteria)]
AKASYTLSRRGLKIGYMESVAWGALGALYNQGCHIAVVLNPAYGEGGIKKFTIGGNGVPIRTLYLPILSELEKGWGGQETVIGSPWSGSVLEKNTIIDVILKNG